MSRFKTLVVKDVVRETSDCISIELEVPEDQTDDFKFTSGQYLTLRTNINGESVQRPYSLCVAPHEGRWKVAVKKIPNGVFSTYVNDHLNRNDSLEVMAPIGSFCAEHEIKASHYLGIAAGSGITPVISILKTVLHDNPKSKFTLLYGNKRSSNVIFKEELMSLKNEYLDRLSIHFFMSQEQLEEDFYQGRITAEKLESLCFTALNIHELEQAFLCGPQEMIFTCKDKLVELGMTEENVKFELFETEKKNVTTVEVAEKVSVSHGEALVSLKLDGVTHSFQMPKGQNLLDHAIKTGIDAPFSCQGGVCCTCRAKINKGKVIMEVNYALEDDEVAQGYVLTCQSLVDSDQLEVDFDV